MRFGVHAILQRRGEARLADAGFARDQHDLAIAGLGTHPAAQQQVDLLVAPDQPGQRRSAQCLEAARDGTRTQYLPGRHRRGNTLDLDGAEIANLEEIADQPARARGDNDGIWLGQGLQTGGEVRRFADNRLLLRRALADQIADDDQPGGDPDARLELDGFDIQAPDRIDDAEPRADCPLGIVLMRPRVTEIDQHAVAHVFGDKAVEAGDDRGDRTVIGGDDLAQILGIEPRGQSSSSRPDRRTSPSAVGVRHRQSGWGWKQLHCALAGSVRAAAAIAANSLRRWPTEVTPMLMRSSAVNSDSTSPSTSLSLNAGAYCSSPSPRSHAATSMR